MSFRLGVWVILLLFLGIMAGVTAISFSRKSHFCKIDPAEIASLRKM